MNINKKSFVIRKGKLNDLPEMKNLFVNTITEICKSDYNKQQISIWTSSSENDKRWNEMITDQVVLIAEYENKIVGFISLENGNYIDFLYVHKDYQRKGIAKKLYSAIEKEALRQKQTKLSSDVSKTARPFFEKVGYEIVDKQIVIKKNVELTNYKMKKNVENI
ncbi:MAG TPA: GNAT family N-acetyltransferase [Bacteroidetes bacterium]|nr:GNAT family N-acetyltransferase [Bacteroidota bacterium]